MKAKITRYLIPLLIFTIIITFSTGCSTRIPNPENAVQEFWSAFKSMDYEKASGYFAEDVDDKMVQEMLLPDEDEEMFTDEITKAFMERVNLSTEGHEIENDTAIVQVVVEWPNMELLFGKFFSEALGVAFTAALGGATEEELDALFKPIFLEVLEETPDIQTHHEVKLVLIDGKWKLATSPIPDPEELFNLSDFAEEEIVEEKIIEEEVTGEEAENVNAEVTQVAVHIWKDSIDTIWVHGAVEITNTGSTLVEIGNIQISIYDMEDNVIGVISFMLSTPEVIKPGEKAYSGESTILEKINDPNIEFYTKANIDYDKTDKESQNLEVRKIEGTEGEYDDYQVVGEIVNISNEKADDVRICVALYDDNSELIAVMSPYVEVTLNPNDRIAFEGSYPNIPNSIGKLATKFIGKAYNWSWD